MAWSDWGIDELVQKAHKRGHVSVRAVLDHLEVIGAPLDSFRQTVSRLGVTGAHVTDGDLPAVKRADLGSSRLIEIDPWLDWGPPFQGLLEEWVTGPSLPLRTESNLLRMIREARDAISLLSTGDYSNTRESQHLVAQMRIGDAARERLLKHNVWIVPAARIGLITPNAASPDWPMIGSRGLEHAMNTYDPDTSYGFTTWATWCIRCFLRSEPDQGGLTGDREPRTPYPPDRSEAIAIEPRPKED